MAVTKIWGVKNNLGRVIRYVANPSKTWNGNYRAAAEYHRIDRSGKDGIESVIQYTADQMKTEQQYYVSGVNCSSDPDTAAEQMKKSLSRSRRGEYVCFHGYQSFLTGEVSPEQAHRIGIELAERMWGERFEVLVSTHLNTKTVHCHFVVAACSFVDGKRYLANQTTYRELRRVSDEICRSYGLSVLEHTRYKQTRPFSEIKAEEEGRVTAREVIRRDMDAVLSHNTSFRFFWRELESLGYTLEYRGKLLRIRPDGGKRFFRLDRLGEGYSEAELRRRLEQNFKNPERQASFAPYKPPHREKTQGLAALYRYYCHLLGAFPKNAAANREQLAELRTELKRLNRYSEQAKLLGAYHIDTAEQLQALREQTEAEFYRLCVERKKQRNKLRRMTDSQTMLPVKKQISELSDKICRCRREIALCQEIEERCGIVQAVVEDLEKGEVHQEKSR